MGHGPLMLTFQGLSEDTGHTGDVVATDEMGEEPAGKEAPSRAITPEDGDNNQDAPHNGDDGPTPGLHSGERSMF